MKEYTIVVNLTEDEKKAVMQFCLLRPLSKAADLMTEMSVSDPTLTEEQRNDIKDVTDDLDFAGPIFENIRKKMVGALMTGPRNNYD